MRRQDARQRLHRAGQRDQLRPHAAAFIGRQIERLGAQQADLAVEPGEIDRTAGFASARATPIVCVEFFGQRADCGERIV